MRLAAELLCRLLMHELCFFVRRIVAPSFNKCGYLIFIRGRDNV